MLHAKVRKYLFLFVEIVMTHYGWEEAFLIIFSLKMYAWYDFFLTINLYWVRVRVDGMFSRELTFHAYSLDRLLW